MLRAMLRFDPSRRLTIDAALSHPYLSAVRNESKEVVATAPMSDSIESVGEDQDHLHSNVSRTPLLVQYSTASSITPYTSIKSSRLSSSPPRLTPPPRSSRALHLQIVKEVMVYHQNRSSAGDGKSAHK